MKTPITLMLVASAIQLAGCISSSGQHIHFFKSALKCGLTIAQVEDIATKADARFTCQRPGGGELICSAGWNRDGVECVFNDQERLVAYRHLKIRPLTRVEMVDQRNLCAPKDQ